MINKQKIINLLAISVALISFGVMLAMASPAIFGPANEDINEASPSRWVDYGVIPTDASLDEYINYNQFADVLHNLLGYTLDDKYTHFSGHMHVNRHDANLIISQALHQDIGQNPHNDLINGPITFAQLSDIFDEFIQIFITSEDEVNLEYTHLEKALVINISDALSRLFISNIHGFGDIIIASTSDGAVYFDEVSITGSIIVLDSLYTTEITLKNSSVNNMYLFGKSDVAVVGSSWIDEVHLNSPSSLDIRLLSAAAPPDVFINSPHIHLNGIFSNVENNLHNHIIFANGLIDNFHSNGSVMLVGDAYIFNHFSVEDAFLQVVNPQHLDYGRPNLSLPYLELLSAFDEMLHQNFDLLWQFYFELYGSSFDFSRLFSWQGIGNTRETFVLPDRPNETDNGDTGSSAGNGNGGSQPSGTPITNIELIFVTPHLQPIAGMTPGLLADGSFVQRSFPPGQNYTGTISWQYVNGNIFHGNAFNANTAYIARIELAADPGFFFPSNVNVTKHYFGETPFVISQSINSTGSTATFIITFSLLVDNTPPTAPAVITPQVLNAPSGSFTINDNYFPPHNPGNYPSIVLSTAPLPSVFDPDDFWDYLQGVIFAASDINYQGHRFNVDSLLPGETYRVYAAFTDQGNESFVFIGEITTASAR